MNRTKRRFRYRVYTYRKNKAVDELKFEDRVGYPMDVEIEAVDPESARRNIIALVSRQGKFVRRFERSSGSSGLG
jgi:hypothetical protein